MKVPTSDNKGDNDMLICLYAYRIVNQDDADTTAKSFNKSGNHTLKIHLPW